jgi:LysR family nitrogen assimilation transcriptional regulator
MNAYSFKRPIVEFRQVQYFICLFEEGSVTRAARRLNIVQPALSMQIAKLEEDCGKQLFERSKQGMVPTAAARQMYRVFLPIMRDFSHARDLVMHADGEISGHVNIGLITSLTDGVLAETLSAFSTRYPNVGVTVAEGYSKTLADWVAGGQLDAAIINKPRRSNLSLNVEHIVDEDLVLITSARHSPALPARLVLKQIPSLKLALVLPTRFHGLRAILDSFAQHEDVDLTPTLEVDSLEATIKLVEQTQFATILPRIAIHRRLSNGSLQARSIVSSRLIRQVVSVSNPRRPLNSATTTFIGMLTEQMRLITKEQSEQKLGATAPR